jgi:hypothetical protein
MKKIINRTVLVIGYVLVLAGLLKSIGLLKSFELTYGDLVLKLPDTSGTFYIITINFIGGIAMIIHAWLTSNFNTHVIEKQNLLEEKLSVAGRISGILIFTLSFWLFLENVIIVSIFENNIDQFWPLMILFILVFFPLALSPFILSLSNFMLNSKLDQTIKERRQKEQIRRIHGRS